MAKLAKERHIADPELARLDPKLLCKDIKRGIAPAMGTQHDETYWGEKIDENLDKQTKKLLGIRHPPAECAEARQLILQAREVDCNARQLIAVGRGGFGQGEKPKCPEGINGKPAAQPDLFSDGGVKNPTNQTWALGGFGIWTGTRISPDEEMDAALQQDNQAPQLFHQREADEGMARWGPLAGFGTSSTRNELAAALLGLMLPRPVHIGSDSDTFVKKANFLLKAAKRWNITLGTKHHTTRNPMGKPWGMQADGDLWEIFWGAILTRGPDTCAFTWVKGHATEEDIVKGITDANRRYGNDQADRAANEGISAHIPGLLALCRWNAR